MRSSSPEALPHRLSALSPRLLWLGGVIAAVGTGAFLAVGSTGNVELVLALLVLASIVALRRDVLTAVVAVALSMIVDWYQLVALPVKFPVVSQVVAVAVIVLVFLLQSKEYPWIHVPRLWLWALLLALTIYPLLHSIDRNDAIKYLAGALTNALVMWILGIQIARSLNHVRQLLALLVGFGALLALHSIIQSMTGVFILATPAQLQHLASASYFRFSGSDVFRASSFIGDPDWNGVLMALLSTITVGTLLDAIARRSAWGYQGALTALVLMMGALFLTYSTGAWLAFGVAALVLVSVSANGRTRLVILGCIAIVPTLAFLAFPKLVGVLIAHATQPGEYSLRLGAWATALQIIRAYPLTGIGLGWNNYLSRSPQYQSALQTIPLAHPHESYLELAAMGGVPLALVFIALLALVFRDALRKLMIADPRQRILIGTLLAAVTELTVNSIEINGWTLQPLAAIGWLLAGVLASPALTVALQRTRRADEAQAATYGQTPHGAQTQGGEGRGIGARLRHLLATERRYWQNERRFKRYGVVTTGLDARLPPYPIDMAPLLDMPFGGLDEAGVLYNNPTHEYPGSYQPTSIAQYALAQWNAYLATGQATHRGAFMRQANWLVEHQTILPSGIGAWPIDYAMPEYGAAPGWMSALTQGNVISVCLRAYRLTQEQAYLDCARRAVRSFQCDVLDGGVATRTGDGGLFFEEMAVYPASHILNGFILALFGLYDYVAETHDSAVGTLIDQSLRTLHTMLAEYDTGYWSRYDLHHKYFAPRFYHALHVSLLQALAAYSGCAHCADLAARWAGYERRITCRARYVAASCLDRYGARVWKRVWRRLYGRGTEANVSARVVVAPVTDFPVPGGTRAVLASVAGAMDGQWHLEYLTRKVGTNAADLTIHRFGGKLATYRYTAGAWLYALAGRRKLTALLRHGHHYSLMLPQDGLYSGAFAALVGKWRGIRVVCMDHGTLTMPFSSVYWEERLRTIRAARGPARAPLRLGLVGYRWSIRTMARVSARLADHFLVAGDEVYEVLVNRLGVAPRHITRYPYVVDADRFRPPPTEARRHLRTEATLPADAIVVTMINRLAPEKGLDVAIRGIAEAVAALPDGVRERVRIIIAGDGPLRQHVDQALQQSHLANITSLPGTASPDDVVRLLALSDIFLYTGTRGTNFSVAVLEAMAAGCAVVASVEPRSNAMLLADERGIAVPINDAQAVRDALVAMITQPDKRERCGQRARTYVQRYHSARELERALVRATWWPGSSVSGHTAMRDTSTDTERLSAFAAPESSYT